MYSENTWIPDGKVCLLILQEEYSYLGNILSTKKTLSNFHKIFVVKGLRGDLSLCANHDPDWVVTGGLGGGL